MAGEKTLFTLSDPMADYADEDYEKYITLWQEQLAAQLLHPEIHHFQNSIWTGRHFGEAVPAAFSTTQLSVFQAMNDLSGKESTLYAGTGGIALAMSDSMTWLTGVDGAITTSSAREGMYGLSLPLVERGIPLASVCLDRLHSAAQLEQVKILLWPIDVVHPQSQEALQIVADWVRAGGVLIEVGGINAYENLSGEWWGERSPLERLLSLLELDNLRRTPFQDVAMLEWCGPRGYGQHIGGLLPYQQSMNAYCWEGAGSPIVSSNLGDTLGLDVAAGEGRLLLCGLPSAYFSVAAEGPGALRDLVEYATRYTDVLYQESGAMVIRRGGYLIAHALMQEQTITGQFVDLFDAKLPLISSKQVEQNASAMLLDVSSKLEGDTPRLLHTGGTLSAPAQESAEQTRFAISVPVGAAGSTRLAGNGRTMESVSVTLSGQPYEQYETVWDETTGTLLLSLEGNGKPVDITVEWSAQ